MKHFRKAVLHETLLGAMTVLMLLVPCYGQQETDPSWFDPWAPNPAVTRAAKPRAAQPVNALVRAKATDTDKKQHPKPASRTMATVKPVATREPVKIAAAQP